MMDRIERQKKTTGLHLAMEAKETLRRVESEFPDNPAAMQYFYDLYRDRYSEETVPSTNGRKVVGTMCVQVPDELIYAAGAVPLRLCNGSNTYDQIGAGSMPSKACPLVKATVGMLEISAELYKDRLDAIVIPTTCDQKKKSAEMLIDMGYNVHIMEMPASKETDEARHYWQNSVRNFALMLQKLTGKKITKKSLKESVAKVSAANKQFRRLNNLTKSSPPLIFGKDVFMVTNAYFFDDIESWTSAVAKLNDELEERKRDGFKVAQSHAPRILFTGSPPIFPNMKVPVLLEQVGGVIVADEVCSSSRLLYDSVAFDEEALYDMVPAIADRYLKPCTCPCYTPNNDRKRKIELMVKDFAADGVIYQAFSGCHLYEMEQKGINSRLEAMGVPMLYLETDYSPEDMGQLSTRVEAFIESIKTRKRRKK